MTKLDQKLALLVSRKPVAEDCARARSPWLTQGLRVPLSEEGLRRPQ